MKNNKKIASLLLSGVMVAGMIPTNVLAEKAADAVTNNEGQVVTNNNTKAEIKVWTVETLTLTPESKEITEGTDSVTLTLGGTATSTEGVEGTENTPAKVTVTANNSAGVQPVQFDISDIEISETVTINGLKKVGAGKTITVTANAGEKNATATITVKAKETTPEPEEDSYVLELGSYVSATVDGKDVKDGRSVKVGKKVELTADNRKNRDFDKWEYDSKKDVSIKNRTSRTNAYFYMPEGKVTITAKYDKEDSKKDDLKQVYPKDKEKDGRYAEGTLKDYKDTKIFVYYDGDEIGSGWTDKNGDYRISVGKTYTTSQFDKFKYYVDEDSKSKDDLKIVYPKDVELYGKSGGEYRDVKGTLKDYKNEKIYVYLNGNEKGNGRVDKDGDFDFRLSKYIDDKYDEDDLRFYVEDDTKSSSDSIFITRAIGGETKVEGKDAGKDATVEVKDSRSTKLGSTTADKDGKFTVSLNRALVGGETITVTSKVSGKSETKIDYIVPGFGGNINTPSINTNGYIKGYSDGSFQPNGNMTRAEAAVMMARLKNGSDNFNTSGITRFTDANNKWYSKGVNYAVGQGLINGYEDGTFRPDEKITRAEFTQMIANDIKTNGTKSVSFNDVNNHWAKPAIEKVAGNGIINGYEDNSFRPNNNITRAEAVKMLNGISNRPEGSKTNTFNDVRPSDWFYNDVMKAAN